MRLLMLAGAITLTGCMATADLLNDGSLGATDLATAKAVADMMQKTCYKTRYRSSDGSQTGAVKLIDPPTMKAFYKSDSGWVKADMVSQGVYDSVFYDTTRGTFICGQTPWSKSSQSSAVQFTRSDMTTKVTPAPVAAQMPAATKVNLTDQFMRGSDRMCQYSDGSVTNNGTLACPLSR